MSNGHFRVPKPINEPVLSYAPHSQERKALLEAYWDMYHRPQWDVPMYIGADEIRTNDKRPMSPPHDHNHVIGHFNYGDASHVRAAIDAALSARERWSMMPWQDRAAIFLKAADLIAGPYRAKINAATMLAQSKSAYQAEIDAACELIDFLRFNAFYLQEIQEIQPESAPGIWNRLEFRPLEGFVFAITPFNFTAIAGNLPASAALMGNVVVWKPADSQVFSAQVVMEVFLAAGLPAGVINLITVDGPVAGEVVFGHRDFSGLHFTGSTQVFQQLWKTIGTQIQRYRSYPRIVGETGGKDFVLAHSSADLDALVAGCIRGAFELQGQKCSAASRAYIPETLWSAFWDKMSRELSTVQIGPPSDLSNFVNAVIDRNAFNKIKGYIDWVKEQPHSLAEVIWGGGTNDEVGYFIEPTVIKTTDPQFRTMVEEIFGPVLTIYVYPDEEFESILDRIDSTSDYALTGAIFAQDRYAVVSATQRLVQSAGNFYINDKPTGAVVGQQPFGGARGSGTNDKAGSALNLLRWVSPRTIKETLVPPTDYRYPFLKSE